MRAKHIGRLSVMALCLLLSLARIASAEDNQTLRVFIFAGQSNMVGSDSNTKQIAEFPPFAGLDKPQPEVKFSYVLGRQDKKRSDGWVPLQAVNNVVGPELSFARKVTANTDAPIAIIKVAAGGTHLGGDWNPDDPIGFKMYPLLMETVKKSLAELDKEKIKYRIEGFMWHQGENDMFNADYMKNYGKNLKNFLAHVRKDLKTPKLKFYIGELCTKTGWGMDLRDRMYAIRTGQEQVTDVDPLAQWIPTSHVGVGIGGGAGLHYHYCTLGQLEHGEAYADAFLRTIGKGEQKSRAYTQWPHKKGEPIKLFIMAGHRNMEGERAFAAQLSGIEGGKKLLKDQPYIPFKYNLGGGVKVSESYEPLGLTGYFETFGPELSFAAKLRTIEKGNFAIAKFTHSGSQALNWVPEASIPNERDRLPRRNVYKNFIAFIKDSITELEKKGHRVELAGIVYNMGENDMAMHQYKKENPKWIKSIIDQSRTDLKMPALQWFVFQTPPVNSDRVKGIDIQSMMTEMAKADDNTTYTMADNLPEQKKVLVIDTPGIVKLGEIMAEVYGKNSN